MASQLTLIPTKKAWQLDPKTRAAGRKGIAQARAALQAHRPSGEAHPSAA